MKFIEGGTGETSQVTVIRNGGTEVLCEASGGTGGYCESYGEGSGIEVTRRLGKGGHPNGRDASGSAGGAGYALTPIITDGEYGTGGDFAFTHITYVYDAYAIPRGGGGGIDVTTVAVTPGEILNITVGKGGAGAGNEGNLAGSAGAVSIWY